LEVGHEMQNVRTYGMYGITLIVLVSSCSNARQASTTGSTRIASSLSIVG
jgi:hypothetical protein